MIAAARPIIFFRLVPAFLATVVPIACSGAESDEQGWATGRERVSSLLDRLQMDQQSHASAGGEVAVRGVEVGGEERAAIQVLAPQALRLQDVSVPPQGRLRLAVGILDHPNLGRVDGVEIAALVDPSGEREEGWRQSLDPGHRPQDEGWIEAEVPLDRWTGSTVDLILQTDPRKNRHLDRVAWSDRSLIGGDERQGLDAIRKPIQLQNLAAGQTTSVRGHRQSSLAISGLVVCGRETPNDLGPVLFKVTVDGEPVWERAVATRQRRSGFTQAIRLDEWAERRVQIAFDIDLPSPDRRFLKAGWADVALVSEERVPRQTAGQGPNILFLDVDTLRADHLSVYGYQRDTSPILEALARDGTTFAHSISQSSWTMPPTASLMTGLYPTEHGVTDGQALPRQLQTLAETAQDRGLTTLGISADPLIGKAEGFAQGFERFVHMPWARAEAVNNLLDQIIREYAGSRWLAYVHYIDPHDPYTAPAPYDSQFQAPSVHSPYENQEEFRKLVDAVNFGTGAAEWDQEDLEYLKAAYDGEILYWDSELERLLDYLQDLGMRDDTFVIVTSDHGEEFLEHGRLKHGLHLYDQSIRVPLILQGPGAAVGVHEALVETRKLFDLCAALVSADEKEPIELVGFLRSSRDFAFAHTDHGKIDERPGRVELMAVRDAQWKLIEYPVTGRQELDRLGVDSAETRNVFDEKPAVATRYSRLLLGWLEVTSARSAAGRGVDPQILEKLKALGYIQ